MTTDTVKLVYVGPLEECSLRLPHKNQAFMVRRGQAFSVPVTEARDLLARYKDVLVTAKPKKEARGAGDPGAKDQKSGKT